MFRWVLALSLPAVLQAASLSESANLLVGGRHSKPQDIIPVPYYVYEDYPFNWFEVCSPEKTMFEGVLYPEWKSSNDYWLGKHALSALGSSWRVQDPEAAEVFIVPALLTMASLIDREPIVYPKHTVHDTKMETSACSVDKNKMINDLEAALSHSEFFKAGKPHLIEATRWWKGFDFDQYPSISSLISLDFENRTFDDENNGYKHVLGGQIEKNCQQAHTLLNEKPWGGKSRPPMLFHMAGSIDSMQREGRSYINRKQICDAISDLDYVASLSICAASGEPETSWYERDCSHGDMVACNLNVGDFDYCDTLAKSKFLVYVAGDTWSSNRLFDAIALGVVPVLVSERQLSVLPFASEIPWKEFVYILDVDDHHEQQSHGDLEYLDLKMLKHKLQQIVLDKVNVYQEMRRKLLEYRSMILWTVPGSTALHSLLRAMKAQGLLQ